MRMQFVPVLLFILLCLGCEPPAPDPMEVLLRTEIDTLLFQTGLTSVSVGLLVPGKQIEVHDGFLEGDKEPSPSTRYEIASLTKTFTGTLLSQAIVEGKMSLDDDIRDYLEGEFPNLAYDSLPITFRHLATHTGGIPRMFPDHPGLFDNPNFETLPTRINEIQQGFSKEQFMEALHGVVLDTVPGAVFNYSNAGANLIGYCLENLYGQTYEELLQENIFDPLGMKHSGITLSDAELGDMAPGYSSEGTLMPYAVEKGISAEGGIKSTTSDMLHYLAYQLDESDSVIQTAHQGLWGGAYGDFDSGIFWQINRNGDNPDQIFQNGGAYGTSSWVTMIPESGIGIFVVTNQAGPQVHYQLNGMVERVLQQIQEDLEAGSSSTTD